MNAMGDSLGNVYRVAAYAVFRAATFSLPVVGAYYPCGRDRRHVKVGGAGPLSCAPSRLLRTPQVPGDSASL
jgi:hypothetical protein